MKRTHPAAGGRGAGRKRRLRYHFTFPPPNPLMSMSFMQEKLDAVPGAVPVGCMLLLAARPATDVADEGHRHARRDAARQHEERGAARRARAREYGRGGGCPRRSNVPLSQLAGRAAEPREAVGRPVIVYCEPRGRSRNVGSATGAAGHHRHPTTLPAYAPGGTRACRGNSSIRHSITDVRDAVCPYCVQASACCGARARATSTKLRVDLEPALRRAMMERPAAAPCRRSTSATPTSAATTTWSRSTGKGSSTACSPAGRGILSPSSRVAATRGCRR